MEKKFRAWDTRINKFLYKNFYDRNWYTHPVACHTHKSLLPEDKHYQTLEQFTGSKDKNGKEIYEGDTVKFAHIDDMQNNEDDELIFGDVFDISTVGEHGEVSGDFGDYSSWLIKYAQSEDYVFEIIGNTHEKDKL